VLRSAGWWNLQLGWLDAEAEIRSAAVVVLFHAGGCANCCETRQIKMQRELKAAWTSGKRAAGNGGNAEPQKMIFDTTLTWRCVPSEGSAGHVRRLPLGSRSFLDL
jgi:hypothetical protein